MLCGAIGTGFPEHLFLVFLRIYLLGAKVFFRRHGIAFASLLKWGIQLNAVMVKL